MAEPHDPPGKDRKSLLSESEDIDLAAFHLARCLGIIGAEMVAMGVLEHDVEEIRSRRCPAFSREWERSRNPRI